MLKAQVLATLGLALALSVAVSVQPQDFDIDWRTIDAGGLMFSSGGDYELSGTIGQPDAGILSGGEFTLAGGFWLVLVPGDCNSDGGVNLLDFEEFAACVTGPNGGLPEPQCACFDFDNDSDVDLLDWGRLQVGFTGP